ncbi:hypothetical protein GCM10027454_41570 [Algoriphagus aestuariicola]|jgi:hypothetical protein
MGEGPVKTISEDSFAFKVVGYATASALKYKHAKSKIKKTPRILLLILLKVA